MPYSAYPLVSEWPCPQCRNDAARLLDDAEPQMMLRCEACGCVWKERNRRSVNRAVGVAPFEDKKQN